MADYIKSINRMFSPFDVWFVMSVDADETFIMSSILNYTYVEYRTMYWKSCIIIIIIIIIVIVQKVYYEQTKNKLHRKILQCVQAIEQLCKVLKLFHLSQIVAENCRIRIVAQLLFACVV